MGRSSGKGRTSDLAKAEWPAYGIALNESRHALDFSMKTIERPYFKLFYLIEGWTLIRVRDRVIRLNEKQCVAVAKETTHRLEDPGTREVSLFVLSIQDQAFAPGSEERALLDTLNSDPGLSQTILSPMTDNGADLSQFFRIIRREQQGHRPEESMAVRSAVIALLIRLSRARSETPALSKEPPPPLAEKPRIQEMGAYVRNNFAEPLTVTAMAGLCRLPVNRFISAFKRQYGMTPLQFLHRARIDFAKKRLSGSEDSIATICFEAGFNDLSFFYRTFGKITGKSPRAYRQFRQPNSTINS